MSNLTVPVLPPSAPFNPEQRAWLNGYLAGLFQHLIAPGPTGPGAPAEAAVPPKRVLILYGTQTGTAEGLSHKLAKQARSLGLAPAVAGLDTFGTINWTSEGHLLVVTSTYGDGEPPDNATSFWDFLKGDSAPRLDQLAYSVLSLGDTNYAQFCAFGKNVDARFEQLGAKRLTPRADCDLDYEQPAKQWFDAVASALAATVVAAGSPPPAAVQAEPVESEYSKNRPFPARLLTNRLLTGAGSNKEVRHIEISLTGSGLTYEVGDAMGIFPQNCPELVQEILQATGLDGEEPVRAPDGSEIALRRALSQYYDLRKIEDQWPPAPQSAQELVTGLKKLAFRLYSISSSLQAHPEQVHLTVGVVRYEQNGRRRKGVNSTFLAERVSPETPLPIFFHAANHFRLPKNGDTPIIMVGPGTGIAPFRAFLEQREVSGAKGPNWLFFGDQKASTDFLYREQIEAWQASGLLSRLETAFSRDQADKVYVQHRLAACAPEVWKWLQDGAYFYVCGDAQRMAKDVDQALHDICETAGGLSKEAAAEYIKLLKSEKRYARDVY